jgi:hypothetical protein
MAVAGVAGALSAIGTIGSMVGSFIQYSAAQKAEKAREQQMELEASRARREQIRKAQAARARAVAVATNQGAGQTSALLGGIAQIGNEANRNIVAINQDESLGHTIFEANRQAAFGGLISSLGSGVSSLGGAFANNTDTLIRQGYA